MKNVIDRIDAIKANSVTDKEFKSVWDISLNDHMKKVMEHVRETDAWVKKERETKEQQD